ncbi:MAG: hypothetical protein MZV63_01850 [Marinilabiliales bacterium]|nr:hypothetical protein [Marinilabiliales bacterium]
MNKEDEIRKKLTIYNIVKKVDTPTIFFFLGILSGRCRPAERRSPQPSGRLA